MFHPRQLGTPTEPVPAFHPVHRVYDGMFSTHSGKKIDLNEPTKEMIDIEDIAHALSNLCRFGGQSHTFYSVAQHSVLVAALAPPNIQKEALLHDAGEAYLGDVIKPLKVMIGQAYDDIETRFMLAVTERFDLNPTHFLAVKKYDKQALEMEHEYLMKRNLAPLLSAMRESGIANYNMAWTPDVAKHIFLAFYHRYFFNS
jgi:hypothetical protein